MLEYKGYLGKVEFDDEANLFHGEIMGIRDVVTFQGQSVEELRQAFQDSIDDYLSFCQERGEEPDKPCSGRFVIRIDPDLHRRAAMLASVEGKSLNSWVSECLNQQIDHLLPAAPNEQLS